MTRKNAARNALVTSVIAEKRKMYIYSNYLYWLMGITIHFLISLIPTLATMLLIEPVIQNILLYAVMLLPVGPSLGAIIACVLKITITR